MMSRGVDVNDEVYANGHTGRFVVTELIGATAVLQLFGDDINNGNRVYFEQTIKVPVGALTVIGKNHTKPKLYTVV